MVTKISGRSREAPRWHITEEQRLVSLSADRLFRIILAFDTAFPEIDPRDLDMGLISLFEDLGFEIPRQDIVRVIVMIRSGDPEGALLRLKTSSPAITPG